MRICYLLLGFLTFNLSAQQWIDFGVKGGYGANLLINSNAFDDIEVNPKIKGGYMFGVKAGYNLAKNHEITFDFIYSGFTGMYSYSRQIDSVSSDRFDQEINFNSLGFQLLYRNNNDEGMYFEFGPELRLFRNAEETILRDGVSTSADISDKFIDKGYGLVLGFGNYMMGWENVGLTLGVRFNYALSDVIADNQRNSANFPLNGSYDTYKGTNPLSVMLVSELNFDFGYLARANCGKRTKLLLF